MTHFFFISSILLFQYSESSTTEGHDEHWGYEGEDGPLYWQGKCKTGRKQSPINIDPINIEFVSLPTINFVNYEKTGKIKLSNNGHSVIASGFMNWPESDRPYASGGGLTAEYDLIQFHFHWSEHDDQGSEHKLGFLHYPLEVHFVHKKRGLTLNESLSVNDGLAVIGVFYAKGNDGRSLNALEPALNETFQFDSVAEVEKYRPTDMLPQYLDVFYRYEGSLTTPGCNEVVIWTLMAEPVTVTNHQLNTLRHHMSTIGHLLVENRRPVQPLNDRKVQFRPRNAEELVQKSAAIVNRFCILLLFSTLMHFSSII